MNKKCDICGKNTVVVCKKFPYTEVIGKSKKYDYFSCCNYIKQEKFLSPRELNILYSSEYTGYRRGSVKDLVNSYFTYLRVFKYRKNIKGKDILELGCGMGDFIVSCMNFAPKTVEGVEISKYACDFIKKNNPKIHISNGDIENFKSKKRYDTIFLFHVIEHVKDPIALIKKCKSLLKKDGVIVIETPNLDSFDRVIFGKNWFNYSVPYHTHLFSIKSFRKISKHLNLSLDSFSFAKFPNTLTVQFKNTKGLLLVFIPFVVLGYIFEYFISSLFKSSGVMAIILKKK